MADPNWLYSSTAQSAAAIVAIVGGFLTSRVLALAAERRSLENELSDKRSRLTALLGQREHATHELQELRAGRRLDILIYTQHYGDPMPTLEAVKNKDPELVLMDSEVVQQVYEEIRSTIEGASAFVKNHEELIKARDTDFGGWLATHGLSAAGLDYALTARFFAEAVEQKRERSPVESMLRQLTRPLIPALSLPIGQTTKQDPEERIEEEREKLDAQAVVLRSDIVHLEERLRAFSYPPNLWWGLGILAYLTVGGVVVPLAVLPVDVHREELKWPVLALFSSGILALFLYIGAQILDLQKGSRGS